MPYQVKSGALTIVASTTTEALALHESFSNSCLWDSLVEIKDMDGHDLDPEAMRSMIAAEPGKP
jgi:hypothetical protein